MMNNSVMKCCICNNNNVGEYDVINHKKYHICCIEDLKRRVDKAIEYINWWVEDNKKQGIGLTIAETDGLLDILGGKE